MLRCGRFLLPLERPILMGVLNVTPDSFSDGGRFLQRDAAVARAQRMLAEGAAILDIGGESSRPGADAVGEEAELARILPVLEALAGIDAPLSVDTRRARVMREALAAGASMINDIDALSAPGALEVVAQSECAICLMHKKGEPASMQREPHYDDVVREVKDYLADRIAAAEGAGIARARIVADVGFGFGKTLRHNLELQRHLAEFAALGVPLLAGWSRKSSLGQVTGRPVGERLAASVAAALLAAQAGARILRVHDVAPTRDALAVWEAFRTGAT
jgi:dihydropteroate synthase